MHPQIRPGDRDEANHIFHVLTELADNGIIGGAISEQMREVLVVQILESLRRNRYIDHLRQREHSDRVLEFDRDRFDPLIGALVRWREGYTEDAFWLVFLSVHFGRHRYSRWSLCCNFYNCLGYGRWDWNTVCGDVAAVRSWLDEYEISLKGDGAGFGNHRKYESLRGVGPGGTGETIESYVEWVGGSHADLFASGGPDNAAPLFATLYKSMDDVYRFGRTAKFDYLTTLGKLGFLELTPDRLYLGSGATGPLRGARLLLTGSSSSGTAPLDLEQGMRPVQEALSLSFDVIEDALCNWQKSPRRFIAFRG